MDLLSSDMQKFLEEKVTFSPYIGTPMRDCSLEGLFYEDIVSYPYEGR